MDHQREGILVSGLVKLDISGHKNSEHLVRDLSGTFSDLRLEKQPTMEVEPNLSYTEYMLGTVLIK